MSLRRVAVLSAAATLLALTWCNKGESAERKLNIAGPLLTYSAGAAADYAITRANLGLPGVREGNPALQGPLAQVAGQVAFVAATTSIDVTLQKRRSRLLWPFRVAVVGLKGTAVYLNHRTAKAARRSR